MQSRCSRLAINMDCTGTVNHHFDVQKTKKLKTHFLRCQIFRTFYLKNAFSNLAKVMLDMLFHFVAFSYMQYSQSYEASKAKGRDLEKWVRASLRGVNIWHPQ